MKKVRVKLISSLLEELNIETVRAALLNWIFAKQHNGAIVLHVCDIDITNVKLHDINSIIKDLKWLGLDWNEGPDIGGSFGPYKQSQRDNIYEKYLSKLKTDNMVYPCFCSEEELSLKRQSQIARGEIPKYDSKCRDLTSTEANTFLKKGISPLWRFKTPQQQIRFKDMIHGTMEFNSGTIDDFILMYPNNSPSYNFAAIIDDLTFGISHIIRNYSNIIETQKQTIVLNALQENLPQFAHIPSFSLQDNSLSINTDKNIPSISQLQKEGYLPIPTINYLLDLRKTVTNHTIQDRQTIISTFSLDKIPTSSTQFNIKQLNSYNLKYIQSLDNAKLLDNILGKSNQDNTKKRPISTNIYPDLLKIVELIKPHIINLDDAVYYFNIFLDDNFDISQECEDSIQNRNTVKILENIYTELYHLQDFNLNNIESSFTNVCTNLRIPEKQLNEPLRLILTGLSNGPDLIKIILLLGKEKTLKRLKSCIS